MPRPSRPMPSTAIVAGSGIGVSVISATSLV
jgi:hypothetical protein